MEFRTKVELPAKGPKIQHTDRLMIWGSCFSEHIGNLLAEHKFNCDVNPFGVLYNPMSIATSIHCLLKKALYQKEDLREEQGGWYSLMHHSTFSSHKAEDCLLKINQRIAQGHKNLKQADWIIFTWGSSFVYTWKENGEIVGNCHKLSSRLFERKMVSADEITAIYLPLLQELKAVRICNVYLLSARYVTSKTVCMATSSVRRICSSQLTRFVVKWISATISLLMKS